jgi:lipopolysaccharide export system protein LptC
MTSATALANALDWAPRRRLTLRQARRRSGVIRLWRWLCIAVCAGMVGWIAASAMSRSMGPGWMRNSPAAADSIRIINPRFTGRGADNSPFAITALSAVRRTNAGDVIELEQPAYKNAMGRTITATKGVYDTARNTLELLGQVLVQDKSGMQFTTNHAMIDTVHNVAVGMNPLEGAGPLGQVRADSYDIQAEGGRLRLHNNVRGVIADRKNP